MSASLISARLRVLGFNPVGSGSHREGLKVKRSLDSVVVVADLDHDAAAARLSADAEHALVEYGCEVRRTSPSIFYVEGKA